MVSAPGRDERETVFAYQSWELNGMKSIAPTGDIVLSNLRQTLYRFSADPLKTAPHMYGVTHMYGVVDKVN